MDLLVGSVVFEAHPLGRITESDFRADEYRAAPKELYFWNCHDGGSGTPKNPPKKYTMKPRLAYIIPLARGADLNKVKRDQRKILKGFYKDLGKTRSEFENQLRKIYGGLSTKVPYDTLIDPYKASQSRTLTVVEQYAYWRMAIKEDAQRGQLAHGYAFVLMMPQGLRFRAKINNFCKGSPTDDFWQHYEEVPVKAKLKELGRENMRLHREAQHEDGIIIKDVEDEQERETKETFDDED